MLQVAELWEHDTKLGQARFAAYEADSAAQYAASQQYAASSTFHEVQKSRDLCQKELDMLDKQFRVHAHQLVLVDKTGCTGLSLPGLAHA